MNRWTDTEGHRWPITGIVCNVCGLPLIPVAGSKAHPLCDEQDK